MGDDGFPDPTGAPAQDHGVDGPHPAAPPPRSRARVLWRWVRRFGKGTLLLASLVVVAVLGCAAVLTQTGRGQRMVLDFALDRLRTSLAGSLTIGRIGSTGLLGGATLREVRLDAEGGRPFLHADSVRLAYSPVSLLTGRPSISLATIWGLRVEISRYEADQPVNVSRLVAPKPPAADSAGAPTEIGVGRVRVVGGLLEVLNPAEPGARGPTVPSPTGEGRLGRLALENLDLEVDDVVLRLGGPDPFVGFLARFAADVYIGEEPLVITGAQGQVRFGAAGLVVDEGFFNLPGTRLSGAIELGPRVTTGQAWAFSADLATEGAGDLADLRWLDPRVPDGTVRGGLGLTVGGTLDLDLRDLLVELEASRLTVDGGVHVEDGVRLDDLEVQASPVVVGRLEPWIGRELPVDGFLSGRARFDGTVAALATEGRVTLAPTGFLGRPTTAEFGGTVHTGRDPGVTDLTFRLDPLNYSLINAFRPDLSPAARGALVGEATGRLSEGVRFTADVDHRPDGLGASRVTAAGVVSRSLEGAWSTDVEADLAPLSMDLVALAAPDAGLIGALRGTVAARGPFGDLEVDADLAVGSGRAVVEARVDAWDPAAGYRLDVRLEDVAVETVSSRVPERSLLTGNVRVEGSGFAPASLDLTAAVTSGSSRVGGLHVDTARAAFRARDGVVTVDTLEAELGGVSVAGVGSLGLVGGRSGTARLGFATDSLIGLRSLLLGDTVVAADTLSELDRRVLLSEGVDLAALPDTADVAMSGSAEGTVELSGWIGALDVTGSGVIVAARYGPNLVDSARVAVTATGMPAATGSLDVDVDAFGLQTFDRTFGEVHAGVSMTDRAGSARLDVTLRENERVSAEGDFDLDAAWNGQATVRQARATVDTLTYDLVRPATFVWDSLSVQVTDLAVERPGLDPMRLTASGMLARAGESDFDLRAEGVHLEQVAQLAQLNDLDIGGHVDLDLKVTGPAGAPVIDGSVHAHDPRYRTLAVDSIDGSLSYRARAAELDLSAWSDLRRVFNATGRVPMNLAFDATAGDVTVATPMDVRVVADSMPAAVVSGYLSFMEEMSGTLSGDFRIRGTLDQPEPSGVLTVESAAYTIEAIGVRHQGVGGTLTLNPDGTVDVDATARAGGTSTITGTVTLDPLRNPILALTVGFDRFQAVDRLDVVGVISGSVDVTGTYERPFMEGSLRVDQGILFLEEFARTAEIVDLTDPRLFDMVVDTAALSARPLLAEIQNPFLDYLRMDVTMSAPRDIWLRSQDMNVEMGGDLQVSYDRSNRDIVMVGELEALRGSYNVLGRSFEVQSGTVGFIGTPGINPTLDIQALSRIRPAGDRQNTLDVTATVTGTLTQPRVSLSTEEAGLAESDLVSYLVFGRPTSELASGQDAAIQGAAGSLVSGVTGTLFSQLGSAFAQGVGVIDYLSVTQAGDFNLQGGGGAFQGTQIELGQYIGNDVFVVLILRPRPGENRDVISGARLEVALTDFYNVEAFIEDRFLRSALAGFEEISQERILGLFVFREWGY